MTNFDKYLDDLFQKSREEAPNVSFEEVSARFSKTITSGSIASGIGSLFKWNVFTIGLSVVTALIVITAIILNNPIKKEETVSSTNFPTSQRTLNKKDSPDNFSADDAIKESTVITTGPTPIQIPKETRDPLVPIEDTDLAENKPANMLPVSLLKSPIVEFDQVNSLSPATPEMPIVKPKEVPVNAVQFTINELTPTTKLASISAQAQRAGIEYTYVVDLKKKLIREFNVDMSIIGKATSSTIQVSVLPKGKFEITFGWLVNAEGKAITLSDNIKITEAPSQHPLQITLARQIQKAYLENDIGYVEKHFELLTEGAHRKSQKENILNSAGYLFLKGHAYTEAIEILELNTRLFPDKANPWDSLGEAYYKNGDKNKALKAFQKALSINPKFRSSKSWVRKIKSEQ